MSKHKRKKHSKEKQRKNEEGIQQHLFVAKGKFVKSQERSQIPLKPAADLAKPFSCTLDSQGVTVKVSGKRFF